MLCGYHTDEKQFSLLEIRNISSNLENMFNELLTENNVCMKIGCSKQQLKLWKRF